MRNNHFRDSSEVGVPLRKNHDEIPCIDLSNGCASDDEEPYEVGEMATDTTRSQSVSPLRVARCQPVISQCISNDPV